MEIMKMESASRNNADIKLLAMMVAKILRDEHGIDTAPKASEYRLDGKVRFNASTDMLLNLAIDKRTQMTIRQHWWTEERDLEQLTTAASELAENIAEVHSLRGEIAETTAEVRAAAIREFAKARRRGLPYRLLWAQPETQYDRVGDGYSISVGLQIYSKAAKLETSSFYASSREEVIEAIASLEEDQTHLSNVRWNLNSAGATGSIDSVVVNALREAGHDVADALRQLSETEDWLVDLGKRGDPDDKFFCLYWKAGVVYASLTRGNGAHWREGHLTFRESPISFARKDGKLLRDVVSDKVFGDSIRIHRASGKKGGYASAWCSQDLLHFDAATGELWAA